MEALLPRLPFRDDSAKYDVLLPLAPRATRPPRLDAGDERGSDRKH